MTSCIVINKDISSDENLSRLVSESSGFPEDSISIDFGSIRDSNGSKNTSVDATIMVDGVPTKYIINYNRVSLSEVGKIEEEKDNDFVLNYSEPFDQMFKSAYVNGAFKDKVAANINIPSDDIEVSKVDTDEAYMGLIKVHFLMKEKSRTIKDSFVVNVYVDTPTYTIFDKNFEYNLGAPYMMSNIYDFGVFAHKKDEDPGGMSISLKSGGNILVSSFYINDGKLTDLTIEDYKYPDGNIEYAITEYLDILPVRKRYAASDPYNPGY